MIHKVAVTTYLVLSTMIAETVKVINIVKRNKTLGLIFIL